jgi:hypothetical protein
MLCYGLENGSVIMVFYLVYFIVLLSHVENLLGVWHHNRSVAKEK